MLKQGLEATIIMITKDRYTLTERSNTLIEQSYRFVLIIYSQHQGFMRFTLENK